MNLNVLALVALFTGSFLVFSLQVQATLARRPQLAYLRAAGVTSGELQRLLVAEAATVGVVGSALGLLLGAAIASADAERARRRPGQRLLPGTSAGGCSTRRTTVALCYALGLARRDRRRPRAGAGSGAHAARAWRCGPAPRRTRCKPLGRLCARTAAARAAALLVWLPPVGGISLAATWPSAAC